MTHCTHLPHTNLIFIFVENHNLPQNTKAKKEIFENDQFFFVENIAWHKTQSINKWKNQMEETSRFECIEAHWNQQSFWKFYEVKKD